MLSNLENNLKQLNINDGHVYQLVENNINTIKQLYVFQKVLYPLGNTNADIVEKAEKINVEQFKQNQFGTLIESANLLADFITNLTQLFNEKYLDIAKQRNWSIAEFEEIRKLANIFLINL